MKTHTKEFKDQIKKLGRELDSQITYTLNNEEVVLGKEQLNAITPHYEGDILKSVMKQLDIDSNVDIPVGTEINYQFGVKVGNDYEYLDFGNYIVYSTEKQEDTRSYKIVCYDKMLYAMKDYERLDIQYPITIKNYLSALCTKINLTLKDTNFVNYDKEITNELYLDSEGNSLNYTYRDVLDEIAGATASTICINDDDELEVRYVQNVGTYSEVEGDNLTLANVDDGKDIKYYFKGQTSQSGTPTPTSPQPINITTGRQVVSVCGKNLFDKAKINWYRNNDGAFTNQTNNSTIRIRTDSFKIKGGQTYTISGIPSGINLIAIRTYNANKERLTEITYRNTFTLTSDTEYIHILCGGSNFTSATNELMKNANIMLNEGATALPYEEYKGNDYEINLGKNYFDINGTVQVGTLDRYNYGFTLIKGTNRVINFKLPQMLDAGTYTLSFDMVNSNLSAVGKFGFQAILNGTSVSNNSDNTNHKITFTTTSQFNALYFYILSDQANDATITIDNVQLEKGSTKTSFSPYKTPIYLGEIGNYKDYIVKTSGKNLFDKDNANLSVGYFDTSGVFHSGGTSSATQGYIPILPNTNMTLSGSKFTVYCFYDKDKSFIERVVSTKTEYTFNKNAYFMRIQGATSDMNVDTIQLEEGNQATLYEPYGEGQWYIHKEIGRVVLNGSESWSANEVSSGGVNYKQYYISFTLGQRGNGYSNYFVANGNNIPVGNYFYINNSGTLMVFVHPSYNGSDITSTVDWKSWLGTHNTEVYYLLKTPTNTLIEDEELINQLNSIELLDGLNNISITSNDLSAIMNLKYLSERDTIDEEYLKDINVNFGEKYGPVNSVVFSRSAESDNIYRQDEDSINENGLHEIKIVDNQILNGNNRDQFIDEVFNQLNGFEYYANDFSSTGIAYYNLCDRYNVRVDDNIYSCIMMNDELDVTQGLIEQIHTDIPENSETDYKKADKTDRRINETWIIANKQEGYIEALTSRTTSLEENTYTITQVNDLIQNAETGITNTFTEAGGNNIFRNTGLWFESNDENNPYEFWTGVVARVKEERASNMNALSLQNTTLTQQQVVSNGSYTISFKYKRLLATASLSVFINGVEYQLVDSDEVNKEVEYEKVIEVQAQHIDISFVCDMNNGFEIYDLMVNSGQTKLAYSQNQNETTTDTVNISKGITITSSDLDVKFKADADGIRTLDNNNNIKTKFTDVGMETEQAIIKNKSQIVGTLWQEINGQTWITRL